MNSLASNVDQFASSTRFDDLNDVQIRPEAMRRTTSGSAALRCEEDLADGVRVGGKAIDGKEHRMTETARGSGELRKYLEDEKITVRELGGWECAKCHY